MNVEPLRSGGVVIEALKIEKLEALLPLFFSNDVMVYTTVELGV